MTTMQKVEKIKADIAALPKEYRSLVQAEEAWAAKHPVIYTLAVFAAGAVVMLGVVLAHAH